MILQAIPGQQVFGRDMIWNIKPMNGQLEKVSKKKTAKREIPKGYSMNIKYEMKLK
jgi:hypothetical protein